jgi:hypothetical protein
MKKIAVTTPTNATKSALTRRKFVETTAVAGGTSLAAPFLGGKAPAYAQARKLHYLQGSSFVPAADVEVNRQAEEFKKRPRSTSRLR